MIKDLRKEIDKVDKKIISLISKRLKLAEKIGKEKKKLSLTIKDKKREEEILKNLLREADKNKISKELIKRLFKEIILESRKIQK
jgi:monofunctional chorismate mutase